MREPRWLSTVTVLTIHSDQITSHGGSFGLRDRGLLQSALDRPQNRFHYQPEAELPTLAACYGFGIARNHPFVDGNKRVAFQAMYVFLGLNGLRVDADEEEVVGLMVAVAAGKLDEEGVAAWLGEHTVTR